MRHREKLRVDPREHRRHHRRGEHHRPQPRPGDQGPDPRHQGVPLRLRRQCRRGRHRRRRHQPGQVVGPGAQARASRPGPRRRRARRRLLRDRDHARELVDIMFEDLELPDLERKKLQAGEAERVAKRKGYRKVGVRVHLDRRRTVGQAAAPDRRRRRRSRRPTSEDAGAGASRSSPSTRRTSPTSGWCSTSARRATRSSSASWTPRAPWTR